MCVFIFDFFQRISASPPCVNLSIYVLQVTCPIDEGTFLSADLHLLESIELKKRTNHIVEIIEEVKWEDVDPDMLTRFHFVFTPSLMSCGYYVMSRYN
jgi:UDP-glucose:glycoprotein glucosyltransferase